MSCQKIVIVGGKWFWAWDLRFEVVRLECLLVERQFNPCTIRMRNEWCKASQMCTQADAGVTRDRTSQVELSTSAGASIAAQEGSQGTDAATLTAMNMRVFHI